MKKLPESEKRKQKSHTFDQTLYKEFQDDCKKHGRVPSKMFHNYMKRHLEAI